MLVFGSLLEPLLHDLSTLRCINLRIFNFRIFLKLGLVNFKIGSVSILHPLVQPLRRRSARGIKPVVERSSVELNPKVENPNVGKF